MENVVYTFVTSAPLHFVSIMFRAPALVDDSSLVENTYFPEKSRGVNDTLHCSNVVIFAGQRVRMFLYKALRNDVQV